MNIPGSESNAMYTTETEYAFGFSGDVQGFTNACDELNAVIETKILFTVGGHPPRPHISTLHLEPGL